MSYLKQETKKLQAKLGEDIRALRLLKNLDQKIFCKQAEITISRLRQLEKGQGPLATLIQVILTLNRQNWLESLAPVVSINPLHMVKGKARKRARK